MTKGTERSSHGRHYVRTREELGFEPFPTQPFESDETGLKTQRSDMEKTPW
jgi:hypothetical protein